MKETASETERPGEAGASGASLSEAPEGTDAERRRRAQKNGRGEWIRTTDPSVPKCLSARKLRSNSSAVADFRDQRATSPRERALAAYVISDI
jgi:hypothetical protein